MALYPDVIGSLLASCEAYEKRELELDALKARVWEASCVIVAYEERDLRQLLMRAEGEIDSIQFTTDDDKIFGRTLDVVRQLKEALWANLAA